MADSMDEPEEYTEAADRVRQDIGAGAVRIMDATTPDVLEAVGELSESARRLVWLLHEGGVAREQVAGILATGACAIVYTELPEGD